MTTQTESAEFEPNDCETLKALIRQKDLLSVIKFANVSYIKLGPSASLSVKASLDAPDEWAYNIFRNSRYAIFMIHNEKGVNKLELISSGLNMPKFRKCKIKSLDDASLKIAAYFAGV